MSTEPVTIRADRERGKFTIEHNAPALVGRRASFTTFEGETLHGVVELGQSLDRPIVRLADGRWGFGAWADVEGVTVIDESGTQEAPTPRVKLANAINEVVLDRRRNSEHFTIPGAVEHVRNVISLDDLDPKGTDSLSDAYRLVLGAGLEELADAYAMFGIVAIVSKVD